MKLYFARTWTNLDKYARLFQNESRFSLSNSALSFRPLSGFPSTVPWHRLRYPAFNGRPSAPTYSQFWTMTWADGHALSVVCKIRKASTTQYQIHFIFRTTELERAQVTWNVFLATYQWDYSSITFSIFSVETTLSSNDWLKRTANLRHSCDQQLTNWSIIWTGYVAIDSNHLLSIKVPKAYLDKVVWSAQLIIYYSLIRSKISTKKFQKVEMIAQSGCKMSFERNSLRRLSAFIISKRRTYPLWGNKR